MSERSTEPGLRVSRETLLQHLRETGFAELAGSSAQLRLVVDEALINRVLEREVVSRQPHLRQLTVAVKPGNHVDVRVRMTTPLMPSVTIALELAHALEPGPPRVLAFQVAREGVSTWIGALLPQLADRMPPGVHIVGRGGTIDLDVLLARHDLAWILPYITRGEIETLQGQLLISVDVQV